MAQKTSTGVKVEETSKEIHCTALGFEYRSKMMRVIEILETPEGQAVLEKHCGSTATKFRNRLAGIGTHLHAAGIAAVVIEFLKGAVASTVSFLKGGFG